MRRHPGTHLICAAAAFLVLGCAGLGEVATGVGGDEGTGGGVGSGVTGGGGTAGVGGGPIVGGDATAVKLVPPDALCVVTDLHSDPVFLSVPRARAMVSATQVRGILLNNLPADPAPPPANLRVAELLGYYHIDYPVAPSDELTVVAELMNTEVKGQLLLQIGVQAPKIMLTKSKEQRRQTSLTVLVDTSKSMAGESMARANAAVTALASSLNAGDVLNLVTTNTEAPALHRIAASKGDPALFPLTSLFSIGGAGSLQTGVDRAYAAATESESLLPTGLNRVVVITDGGGLADAIAPEPVRSHWIAEHIQLVGVGVGNAKSYRNDVLGAATSAGHGANLYLDSVKEAVPALHDHFDEVMDEAAGDVTIGIAVPSLLQIVEVDAAGAMISESQLWTSDLGRRRSMVFRHLVTACASPDPAALLTQTIDITTSWTDPAFPERQSRVDHITLDAAMPAKISYPVLKTSAILAFGGALSSLTPSRFKDACTKLTDARTALSEQSPGAAADPELDSILAQIQRHPVMTAANAKCP